MKLNEVNELIRESTAQLAEALAEGKSEELCRLLDIVARFPRYSISNCMLIAAQRPHAELVQGYQAWRKLGRFVKKGEKGIGIIAPLWGKEAASGDNNGTALIRGFRVVHVYDISQTEGEDLPQTQHVKGEPGEYLVTLQKLVRDKGIELVYEPLCSGALGESHKGRIIIQPELSEAEHFATLVHELAHELLHSSATDRKTKSVRETEAEAVAHVVCRSIGLDSTKSSADYIALNQGDKETLYNSLGSIQKTAAAIIQDLQQIKSDRADAVRRTCSGAEPSVSEAIALGR